MVTIDHLYYPHIIDALFTYSDPASLAPMAKTCRAWRQRCLDRFYHISDLRILQAPNIRLATLSDLHGTRVSLSSRELALLAGCRVLDITSYHVTMRVWYLHNLQTVRYHQGLVDYPPLRAGQLVFKNELPPFRYRNTVAERLVIYFTGRIEQLAWYNRVLPYVRQLVFIFEDNDYDEEDCPSTESNNDGQDDSNLDHSMPALRAIKSIIEEALNQPTAVVLVGTERWSLETFDALQLDIDRVYEHYDEHLHILRPLTLSTLGTYRKFVGEREWSVITDWTKMLCP
ncbi:hypothetical protein A1Q2_02550 [Trichosporon asahii var. asahii CBS 8904]|uniref:F-box domain-containing protein n=1 Tax=Trichosporon asahii var. asahii (strain CBS 8904) TaxID=1220162 RepID=K1VR79_TRIAC|nr:hypothetical protein A1Q2_02550 [Trichosporon asahii var. asahii CBS 8904]